MFSYESNAEVGPAVCLITKGELTEANFKADSVKVLRIVASAVRAGVSYIQLREKMLPACLLLSLAEQSVDHARTSGTRILVNDRPDIAVASGAHGVHLRSDSIAALPIRKTWGPQLVIGKSAHSRDDVVQARDEGADFVTLSPVFSTPGKGRAIGIGALRAVCADLHPFPVLALGGINGSNYREVLNAGAAGFAAIQFLNDVGRIKSLMTGIHG
jgi:thiamine-phosphate pyrophosphorylase